MTTTLEWGERSASRPGRSLPPGKTRYPLYRRLGGPQGRSGRMGKILPPPGFDPRTVQPVVSIPTTLPGPQNINKRSCYWITHHVHIPGLLMTSLYLVRMLCWKIQCKMHWRFLYLWGWMTKYRTIYKLQRRKFFWNWMDSRTRISSITLTILNLWLPL